MTADALAPRRVAWPAIAVSGVAALFYAYAVWNAVGNLLLAASFGLNATGWAIWVFSALFPIVVYILTIAVGVRWTIGRYAFLHLVGLSIVAVFWFNVVAYTTMYTANLLG